MLTALIPTVLITALGIILVATGGSKSCSSAASWCWPSARRRWPATRWDHLRHPRGRAWPAVQNEFLSSVSHELRTPLTSIRMFIETLREERVTDRPRQQRCLTMINQELARLDGLVGKLIELSKIESRHAAFERRAGRRWPTSSTTRWRRSRPWSFGSDVDVRRAGRARAWSCRGDRGGAGPGASGNLLSNAWKYTQADGEAHRASTPAPTPRRLSSRSPTTASASRAANRRRSSRSSSAARRRASGGSPGSGLGLAIVRAIVAAHRGTHRRPLGGRPRRPLPHHAARACAGGGVTTSPAPRPQLRR